MLVRQVEFYRLQALLPVPKDFCCSVSYTTQQVLSQRSDGPSFAVRQLKAVEWIISRNWDQPLAQHLVNLLAGFHLNNNVIASDQIRS